MKHDREKNTDSSLPVLIRNSLVIGVLTLTLTACETPLNRLRANRLAGGSTLTSTTVASRALVVGLKVDEDGRKLTRQSILDANSMLNDQGRLPAQMLTITPYSQRGEVIAQSLARALVGNGARKPVIEARPQGTAESQDAQRMGWDLELQSDALVVSLPDCKIGNPDRLMMSPFDGMGPLGCATRANLAAMVSDPRDLQRPRTLDGGNGAAAVGAVTRYQTGEIRDLIDIDFEE